MSSSKISPEAIIQGVIVEANELNTEKYDLDMDNALTWSTDNRKIENKIMEVGYDRNTTMNIHFIKEQYTNLDFTSTGVCEIDRDLLTFPNLKSLELSQNGISRLTNLPLTLEECIVSQNRIEKIDSKLCIPALLYLNLSANLLNIAHLGSRH